MPFLLYLALGVLLVMLLHLALTSYMRTSQQRVKMLGTWLVGTVAALASVFSPALRRLAFMALLLMPWGKRGGGEGEGATGSLPRRARPRMAAAEAREVLSVGKDATAEEIEASYRRLMRVNHPDQGGSDYFAKKLNEAREVLLKVKP